MLGRQLTSLSTGRLISDEEVIGDKNGINLEFTTSETPIPETFILYLNGIKLKETTHYTLSANTITMNIAPSSDDLLICMYNY